MVELNLGTIQELSSMLRLYKTVWETVRAQQEKLSQSSKKEERGM